MINSPRSLQACAQLGVEPSELYQLTIDKFKEKYPELINSNEKLIQIRYEAEEKFREETIKQVKEARNKIIEQSEKKNEETTKEMTRSRSKISLQEKKNQKIKRHLKNIFLFFLIYQILFIFIFQNNFNLNILRIMKKSIYSFYKILI